MLDYAANSVLHWPVEALRAQLDARCEAEGRAAEGALAELIGPNADIEAFWAQVRTNLQAGRIRLLFVADRIPAELRRVVEFLNRQMQPAEVLAVELRQYEGQGLKTLVPIVLGQTQDLAQKKSGGVGPKLTRAWDEASILAATADRGDDATLTAARDVVAWIRRRADKVAFNSNPSWGSIGAEFEKNRFRIPALRLGTDATMAVCFEYMLGKPVFDDLGRRQQLLGRLNAVPGIRLPPDAVSKRKTIRLADLNSEAVTAVLAALDWFVETLRSDGDSSSTRDKG